MNPGQTGTAVPDAEILLHVPDFPPILSWTLNTKIPASFFGALPALHNLSHPVVPQKPTTTENRQTQQPWKFLPWQESLFRDLPKLFQCINQVLC